MSNETSEYVLVRALNFLPFMLAEEPNRLRANAGAFGTLYMRKGRARDRMVKLCEAMAILGVDRAAIDEAVAAHKTAHNQNRPAILTLKSSEVEPIVAR